MHRTLISAFSASVIAVFLGAGPSIAQPPSPTNALSSTGAVQSLTAVKSGNPQDWANTLHAFANSTNVSPEIVTGLARLVRDSSAPVRARAAMALGALGPTALAALPELLQAVRDPDSVARAEVIFALGSVGERTEAVLRGLVLASTMDATPLARRAGLLALSQLGRRPLIAVSADFAKELRAALRSPDSDVRSLALRAAMRADVPWAAEEFTITLRDADPNIRLDAAFALAGNEDSTRATTAIRSLERDSVEWVRDAIPGLLSRKPPAGTSPVPSCSHRAGASTGQQTLGLNVDRSSSSLRDDGRGTYISGIGGVRVGAGTALNLFLPNAPVDPGIALKPKRDFPDTVSRTLLIDLSHPAPWSSGRPRGLVRDAAARIHAFHLLDARRVIWNLRDIPVGASVKSSRTQLNFFLGGRYHTLQFGPWSLGDCGEEYAAQTKLGGEGTTPVNIQRLGEHEYRLWATHGSTGRLWDISDQSRAVDLGLYRFAFDLRVSSQP